MGKFAAYSQLAETGVADTTEDLLSGKLKLCGYIDSYYCFDFNKPKDGNRPYFVSMNRHNEVNINLAYIDLRYISSHVRARFVPGFGTYMNANYAAEPGSLRNIIEASAGLKIWGNRNVWMDVGVFGSPYTNESAISKDHLAYTRSFAPEYVPYYLAGVKFSIPLSEKLNAYLYILNGWQQIIDQNKNKSVGTQLEYRPGEHLLINWNTYFGNERSASDSTIGMRYFSDVYFIYNKNRWSATGCFYAGQQEQSNGGATWWQANLIGSYRVVKWLDVVGRIEHFQDDRSVQIVPITNTTGFESWSSSLGLNFHVSDNALLRVEGRTFCSSKDVYVRTGEAINTSNLVAANVTVWF